MNSVAIHTREIAQLPDELIEAIHALPTRREVEHCGRRFEVAAFEMYATCPQCGQQVKLRGFSAIPEIEDVFDAVFSWMNQPGALEAVERRPVHLKENE